MCSDKKVVAPVNAIDQLCRRNHYYLALGTHSPVSSLESESFPDLLRNLGFDLESLLDGLVNPELESWDKIWPDSFATSERIIPFAPLRDFDSNSPLLTVKNADINAGYLQILERLTSVTVTENRDGGPLPSS